MEFQQFLSVSAPRNWQRGCSLNRALANQNLLIYAETEKDTPHSAG
jgi:hypothetical protein